MTNDKDRAEFEAWVRDDCCNCLSLTRSYGDYADAETRLAWSAWQAARSRSGAVPAGYVLVPIKPTEAQIRAGWNVDTSDRQLNVGAIYGAMIGTAPEPVAAVVDLVRLPVSASDNTHPFAATKWLADNAAQNVRDALEDSDNG